MIRFLGSGFLFTFWLFILILFYCFFFRFVGSDFFLNGFSNPFIVHTRPSFLFEPNFHFSLAVFCSHAAFLHWFSVVFLFFLSDFFSKWWFSQYTHSPFWYNFFVFVYSMKFFELYVRTCLAMFFTFQRIWIVLGRCLFTTRRGVLEKSFFNQIYWSDFWSGKWNPRKKLEWFWCWTKVKSGGKREWFLFIPRFLREREIDV